MGIGIVRTSEGLKPHLTITRLQNKVTKPKGEITMAMRKYSMKPNTLSATGGYHPILTAGANTTDALESILDEAISKCGLSVSKKSAVALINEYMKQAIQYAEETGENVNLSDHFSLQWTLSGSYPLKTAQVPTKALRLYPRLSRNWTITPLFDLVNEEVGFEVRLTGVSSETTKEPGCVVKGEDIALCGEYLEMGSADTVHVGWVDADGVDHLVDITEDVCANSFYTINCAWTQKLATVAVGDTINFIVKTSGGDPTGDQQTVQICAEVVA